MPAARTNQKLRRQREALVEEGGRLATSLNQLRDRFVECPGMLAGQARMFEFPLAYRGPGAGDKALQDSEDAILNWRDGLVRWLRNVAKFVDNTPVADAFCKTRIIRSWESPAQLAQLAFSDCVDAITEVAHLLREPGKSRNDRAVQRGLIDNVRKRREELGHTLEKLAEAVDVSESTISRILRGEQKPHPGLAKKLRAYARGEVAGI